MTSLSQPTTQDMPELPVVSNNLQNMKITIIDGNNYQIKLLQKDKKKLNL